MEEEHDTGHQSTEESFLKPSGAKPRAKRVLTEEQRAVMRERCLKMNADRIAKCREANENVIRAKEEQLKKVLEAPPKKPLIQKEENAKNTNTGKKLKRLETALQKISKLKGIEPSDYEQMETATMEEVKVIKAPPKKKKIIYQVESESEESEPEVVYVKKSRAPAKSKEQRAPKTEPQPNPSVCFI